MFTYLSLSLVVAIGYVKDQIYKFRFSKLNFWKSKNDIPPIFSMFESFYSRWIYRRIADNLAHPVTGVPGKMITIIERKSKGHNRKLIMTENKYQLLNFGSYNYLGFAANSGRVARSVIKNIDEYPVNVGAPSRDIGVLKVIRDLEKEIAHFLKKEDAMVFPMGYGTNTSNIPILLTEGTLVLSDELNHASIITGIKLGKATVRVFKHNDMDELEKILRKEIAQGQPVTHRSWKKIIVFVEGIYSMEGTILSLKRLVKLKEKYKFYIFIDEAHSIGCLGQTGRGICEYSRVDPKDVDILMGTFTKSFAGMGGYIAGDSHLIEHLRFYSDSALYGEQMSPIAATQILESLRCIRDTKEGKKKIRILLRNTKLMREGLKALGFIIVGDNDSPVIPILISNFGKLGEFSRICREEGIGVVIVGYPATPLLFSRVRLCMSSSHTKEDILKALAVFSRCGDLLGLKYNR
ncbi:hypothetical protein evm_012682 [Chilo suppressalis]|nr:hypothetical protein evm_012682 [Chilo suppressalis]